MKKHYWKTSSELHPQSNWSVTKKGPPDSREKSQTCKPSTQSGGRAHTEFLAHKTSDTGRSSIKSEFPRPPTGAHIVNKRVGITCKKVAKSLALNSIDKPGLDRKPGSHEFANLYNDLPTWMAPRDSTTNDLRASGSMTEWVTKNEAAIAKAVLRTDRASHRFQAHYAPKNNNSSGHRNFCQFHSRKWSIKMKACHSEAPMP